MIAGGLRAEPPENRLSCRRRAGYCPSSFTEPILQFTPSPDSNRFCIQEIQKVKRCHVERLHMHCKNYIGMRLPRIAATDSDMYVCKSFR